MNKQLIIISCTLPFGTQSEVKVRTRLSEYRATLESMFDQNLQDETNTIIKFIITPVMGENNYAKIECIYPKESIIVEKLKDFKL